MARSSMSTTSRALLMLSLGAAFMHVAILTLLAKPHIVSNVLQEFAAFMVVLVCLHQRRQSCSKWDQRLWLQLAIAFSIWALGEGVYCFNLFFPFAPRSISYSDLLWLAYAFPLLLVTSKTKGDSGRGLVGWMDTIQAAICFSILLVHVYYNQTSSLDGAYTVQSLALILICVLRYSTTEAGPERIFFRNLLVYVFLYGVCSVCAFAGPKYGLPQGSYIDLCWSLPLLAYNILVLLSNPADELSGKTSSHTHPDARNHLQGISALGLAAMSMIASGVLVRQNPALGELSLVVTFSLFAFRTSAREWQLRNAQERLLQTARALCESEQRLAQAVNVAGLGIFEQDHITGAIHCSAVFKEILGWDEADELTPALLIEKVWPEDREIFASLVRQISDPQGNGFASVEHRIVRPDGIRWMGVRAEMFFEGDGALRHPVRTVGAVQDITERKNAELKLKKSEERFRRVFENAPFGICVAGLDGSIIQVNAALCRMLGYSEAEMLATVWGELDHPDESGPSPERLEQLLQEPGGWVGADKRYIHRDGSVVWGRMRASLVRDSDGHSLYFVIHGEDITAQKRVGEALHESEERFRIMADGCPTMMWVTNAEGGIQFINRACRKFFGIPYEEVEGGKWELLVHPDDLPEYAERFQRAVHEHTTFKIEARVRRADGEWRWVASSAEPRLSSSGEFLGHVGLSPDITERKQAEQVLEFQHSLIHAIHEVSLDGILVVNDESIVMSHNKRFLDILQISIPDVQNSVPDNAVGSPDEPLLSAFLDRLKDPEPFLNRVRELYADHSADDHCEIALKDGRTLERYSTGLRSEGGQYLGRVWFFRDISTRKQAEQALQSSEEKFRQLAENIHEVFWMMPPAANEMLYISPAYAQVWGRTCESLYQNPMAWAEAIHPDDQEHAHLLFARQIQGEAVDSEYRIRTPDGREKWIRDRAFPVRDQAGELIRVVGIAEEITERKRYEAELVSTSCALAASEARYRKLIDLSPDAIIVGQNQAIVLANKAAVELFGVSSPGDLIGRKFAHLVRLEARNWTDEVIQRMYKREMQLPLQEGQVRRTDGSLLDVEFAVSSFSENGGGIVQAVIRNISQRKQAEVEHARLIRSVEQATESVVITDLEGSILYVNPAFEKITGYTRFEAIGSNPRILKSNRHLASFYQEMWATLQRGETWCGNLINKRKDGMLFNEEATISPIKDSHGKVINYVAVKRDVTQEIVLRDQLNQAQKMEAVGRLAGGIAHDFNNLLMVIQSYTEMLQDSLPAHDSLRKNTRQIMKAAERGASLTGHMLAFSRKQIISPVVMDLNAVIEDTTKLLKRVIGEDIEFRVASAELLWAIKADPDQISQVLMNLCVNSRDAMPQGGTLTISTGNVTLEEGSIGGQAGLSPGDYVRFSVADTGTGISKELQARIFEPFFTTKEVSKGTGLGLAIVYGIVKQSSGYVSVNSESGQGTCFTIYLPRVKEGIAPKMSGSAEPRPQGTEILMVAEDEGALREAICDYLRTLGYTVVAASSGQEALLLASQQGHIDLLITDVVMPKMSGRELSQMLGSLRPELKTIFMSGYTDDAIVRHGVQEGEVAFLQKPLSLATLARKVHDMLNKVEGARA